MALPLVLQTRSYRKGMPPSALFGDCELPTLGTRRLSELLDKPAGRSNLERSRENSCGLGKEKGI